MSGYYRLTLEQRYQISVLKDSSFSIREIAKRLKRSASTISRELRRNTFKKYDPSRANRLCLARRAHKGPRSKLTEVVRDQICVRLKKQWSPEQISFDLKKSSIASISHETVYKYIYTNYRAGGDLYKNLRSGHKHRRRWVSTRAWKAGANKLKDRNPIVTREKIVEKRVRLGDFERDTMLGKNGRLLTLVDRTSRLTKIGIVRRGSAFDTHYETLRLLENETVHTITNDHGSEFGLHDMTEKILNIKIYFAQPYCAWQRGTNENTNGLIRQYFPKGYDFSTTTEEDLKRVEDLLNNRPRKCLGFRTPLEVHNEKSQVLR